MNKQKIIIIAGPTGVGKTALSIEVAKTYNCEIIGADCIQVYKELDIGSAKITEKEKEGIKHHLIDIIEPTATYSAGDYVSQAKQAINDIYKQNKVPLIVGGTGMYIQSLLFDIGASCGRDDEFRKELEQQAKNGVNLHDKLKEVDPESADKIHPNHLSRIIRALEIYHLTGLPKSKQKNSTESNYNYLLIGLTADREILYNRINKRVDKMVDSGLLDEVQHLIDNGITLENQCMQGIGYKEPYAFLKGKISKQEFIELLKLNSRHYAKRQLTWLRKMPNIIWKTYEQKQDIFELIDKFLKN